MIRYGVMKITDGRYMVVTNDNHTTLALGRALPDLDIFQATVIADVMNKESVGDTLVAIIDKHFTGQMPPWRRNG